MYNKFMNGARPLQGQTRYEVVEIYDNETGVLRIKQVLFDGKLHAPPNGDPSHAAYDEQGRPIVFIWHDQGRTHRESETEPSHISFYPNERIQRESFDVLGRPRDPRLGPYIQNRHMDTGEVLDSQSYQELMELAADCSPLEP
ncbi:MAG: hypothetical protein AAGK02_00820 [Pseudomonadota bacterium]